MNEKCQRCGIIGSDRRTLWMSCLYAMEELGVPFEQHRIEEINRGFYTLRVCKRCRAEWMASIAEWFNATPDGDDDDSIDEEPVGTGIFIRELGVNREITQEEWHRRQASTPNTEPPATG